MEDRSERFRWFYAKLICAAAKVDDPRIEQAFREIKREPFAGPGPWWLNMAGHAYSNIARVASAKLMNQRRQQSLAVQVRDSHGKINTGCNAGSRRGLLKEGLTIEA